MSVIHSARSRGKIGIYLTFSIESPHQGDSNENTQYTIFNIKEKITLNYPKPAAMFFFFQETKERVRNSHGKQHISVRATEGLFLIEIVLTGGEKSDKEKIW